MKKTKIALSLITSAIMCFSSSQAAFAESLKSETVFCTYEASGIAAVSGVKGHSTKNSVTVRWKSVKNVDGYQIYCSTKKDSGFKKAGTLKAGKDTAFTVSKLKPDKQYYFKIRAYKGSNEGAFSKAIAVKTQSENGTYRLSGGEGKTLRILSYNNSIESHIQAISDKLPNVKIEFCYIKGDFSEYYENLGKHLKNSDEPIDIFLCEPSYIDRYINYGASFSSLGITEKERADMFGYTRDMCSDSKGVQRAAAFVTAPGVFIYNRDIAKKVFGTDNSEKIQAQISDWDKFLSASKKLKEKGYYMLSDVNSMYYAFDAAAKKPFVSSKGTVQIDRARKKWVDTAYTMVENGYAKNTVQWDNEWYDDFSSNEVFGYFAADWFILYVLGLASEGSSWAVCTGPQSFFWGGDILAVNKNSDNYGLAAEVLRLLCLDGKTVLELDEVTPNNRSRVNKANGKGYDILKGQNPYVTFRSSLDGIDYSKRKKDEYYGYLYSYFISSMHEYISGGMTYNEALYMFEVLAKQKIQELSAEKPNRVILN